CGDSADNIPGVKGIGPKGATKLLQEFGTLEKIYENLEKISAKGTHTKLVESRDNAFLSQKLAKIVLDVPLGIPEDRNFKFDKKYLKNAIPFLEDNDLKSLVKKIRVDEELDFGETEESDNTIKFETIVVDNYPEFQKLLREIKSKSKIAIDTETTDKDPFLAELVGISICLENKKAYYIPIAHQMAENLEMKYVLNNLQETLKGKLLIAHNFKYDFEILLRAGWKIQERIFDTILADYLINPTSRHSLEACSDREFEYKMTPIKDLIGTGKKQVTFDLVPVSQAAEYSAEDANITFRLYSIFKEKLKGYDLMELYKNIEIPLIYSLAEMEQNGVRIDTKILSAISSQNQKKLAELTKKIYEIAGSQFNLNSTQQLGKVLFEDLGIPYIKKTKTGYSTDVTVLETLAKKYEIAQLLMDYRRITKLESTYVTALPKLINPHSERIHSSFNQTNTSTGRLSSSNPNLQNIPIRSEMGKEIRKAFVPENDDWIILSADYSQIELRLLAILSKDEKMIEAFRNNEDIHSQTASIIFGKPKEEISADDRRYAKIINFGLMYGMGAFRISKELDISRKEANEFVENYFSKFPTIRNYISKSLEKAKENGFVSTIFGRKLYLPGLNSKNKRDVQEAQRVATNMPIQGSAADIIKIAMINLHEKLKNIPEIKMIIQVHDELVFEVRKSKLDFAKELIITEMENALPKKYSAIVPLVVDVGAGKDWFDAH
ncbi:MAG TPA: DNA polymerase I, partial [Candidatus Cloacimonetes bacterium]|nr:DNA polymerase I [Candidatus Cloacimonadota bacterium]